MLSSTLVDSFFFNILFFLSSALTSRLLGKFGVKVQFYAPANVKINLFNMTKGDRLALSKTRFENKMEFVPPLFFFFHLDATMNSE